MNAPSPSPPPVQGAPAPALSRAPAPPPLIVLYTTRERARTLMRGAFPRRRARLVMTRTPDELEAAFRASLVDAAVVDLAAAGEETWRAPAPPRGVPRGAVYGPLPAPPPGAPAPPRRA